MTIYAITDTKKGEQALRLLIFKLPPGANVPRNESSTGAKVLYGLFAPGNESAEKLKGQLPLE